MMKTSYNQNKKKRSIKDFFPLFLFIAVISMSIGFAQIGSTELNIGGLAQAGEPEIIYISNVELVSSNNATETHDYVQKTLKSNITLDETDPTSSITYNVTLKNNTRYAEIFSNVVSAYNNPTGYNTNQNIVYEINSEQLNTNTKINGNGGTITFEITFHYLNYELPEITDENISNYNELKSFLSINLIRSTDFAIYSEIDNSLRFYKREYAPDNIDEDGVEFYGQSEDGEALVVTNFFSGVEDGTVRWSSVSSKVTKIIFEDEIKPLTTANWFNGFTNVETINLEKLNTSKVTTMNGMFKGCSKLTYLNFGENFNTSNVSSMNRMFAGDSSLKSLDLSNFNTISLNNVNYMFEGASKLTEIKLNNNFITSNVSDLTGLFSGCSSLKSIDLSGFNTSNVTSMNSIFSNCSSLTSLDLSEFDTSNVRSMANMFEGCSKLSYLNFGENFDTSNVTSMNRMFSYLQLVELDLSGFDTSNVADMGSMFYKIGGITLSTLDLSSFNTLKVTSMNRMFAGANGITTLDLSSFETNKLTNTDYMFEGFSSLITIYVNSFVTDSLTNSYNMFSGCSSLVGGNGTVYDSTIIDKTYARIDTPELPGYFTLAPSQ